MWRVEGLPEMGYKANGDKNGDIIDCTSISMSQANKGCIWIG